MKLGRCETCETLRAMLEGNTARFDALMEKYHALRVQGANPAEAPKGLPAAARPSKPADQAIEAVVERFNGNVQLRRRLMRFVNMERQKPNADEDQIAGKVLNWSTPDEAEEA